MDMRTEYLVIIERDAAHAFYHLCDAIPEFNKLLQTNPEIIVDNNCIKYRGNLEFRYEVTAGGVEGKEQRYFQVKIAFDGEESGLEEYTSLLRSIKSIIHTSGVQPQTLWDDVSFHYAKRSYPLINKAENLMRKLITYFMLTNVGKDWVTEASPTTVREAIDKSKRKEYLDVLHKIDFIHLGEFLFKPYQTRQISELYEKLENAANPDDLDLDDLRTYKAMSNWQRYFSSVVDCTDDYLNAKWKDLYELRCMIAHNAIISKGEYERIDQLVAEVSDYLQKAIDNLDKVHVPTEDKDLIAESALTNVSTLSGQFIQLWKSFEIALSSLRVASLNPSEQQPVYASAGRLLQELYDNNLIDDELLLEGRELTSFRNRLLHDATSSFSEQEITAHIMRLESLLRGLRRSWKDEVVNALRALGGRATLAEIYDYIEGNTARKLPENWNAAIRKTLQVYSSDMGAYKGGEDLFEHLGKAYWALRGEVAVAAKSERAQGGL